jgi:capsular exopolysaccharide synthesis family protein
MLEDSQSLVKTYRPGPPSRSIAPNEVRTLAPQQLSVAEVWRTFSRRKVVILSCAAVIFLSVAAYTFFKTPVYEGLARLQIDPSISSSLGLDGSDKSGPVDIDGRLKTEVAIIQSNTVAMHVLYSLALYKNPHFADADTIKANVNGLADLTPAQRQRLLDKFYESLTVKVIPSTQVVEIRFRSIDRAIAIGAANSIIDEYIQRNFETRVDSSKQVSQWLAKQMEDVRTSTANAQQKLAEFQKENNFLGDESDNIVTDRLKQLNEELTQAEGDRIIKEGRYRLARSGNPELIASAVPNTTLQALRAQEVELQAQYAQLNAKFGSGYPKLRELQSQLIRLNSAIAAEGGNVQTRMANDYSGASKAESMIRAEFLKQKEEAYRLNAHAATYQSLKHEVESGQHLYDALQLKLKEAGITSGLTSAYVSVVDRAQIPDRPVEPRKALYLALGLGGGLFSGFLLGLILDSFDDTIRTSEELEAITALPELGCVPFLPALARKKRRFNPTTLLGLHRAPAMMSELNCQGVESYRALCSQILLASPENPAKVLVTSSALPAEGKSTVSCNLAIALAQHGRHVLLVDADMRRPSFKEPSGTLERPGLSTLLANRTSQYAKYQPMSDLPNLHLLPAGPPPVHPTEILASAQMQRLMEAWSKEYDHVIVDTPPVLPFADAIVLASRADGVILVTRSGVSNRKALLRVRDLLLRSGANIMGVVRNAVKHPEFHYSYPADYTYKTGGSKPGSPADDKVA